MGGSSSQQQTQSSTTQPWMEAQPMLKSILGSLNGQMGSTNLSGVETGALNTLQTSANAGNPYAGQIGSYATNLLNGGGATAQAGAVGQNLTDLQSRLGSFADPNYSTMNNPALQAALQQVRDDVGQNINGQFAAAGRDLSGANQNAWGRGVTAAQAPLILDQFNRDQALRTGSAQTLYDAGNATAGLQTGMTQTALGNQQAGVGAAQSAMDANNYGANTSLAIEAQRRGIPMQALGLLAQIGIPIAGLGSQASGTATGTQQMSGAQQFATIAGGIGSMMPKFPIKIG